MIDPLHRGDIQIDRGHNAALCREIGERLAVALGERLIQMPPGLKLLMSRLLDERPKYVNSIH